jgi:hypothetical protein
LAVSTVRLRSTLQDEGEVSLPAPPPERELWEEVALQAVRDIGGWFAFDKWTKREARKAARWLFSPIFEKDFFEVCEMGDNCPQRIRDLAKRAWLERLPEEWKAVQNALWEEVIKT